jgi:predicted ArsR family transcriptional regulator
MNNENNTPVKRRGRPPYNVAWPEETFTAKDVYQTLDGKLSAVSVQLKINKAVKNGELQRVGQKRQSMGRPTIVYRTVSRQQTEQ